jgi:hypothetical protein
MEKVNKYGRTFLYIKAIGRITKLTEKEDLFIQMVTYIKDNGKMIKHMEKESIIIQMGLHIKVNGNKTSNKDLGYSNGLMDHYMKGIFLIKII